MNKGRKMNVAFIKPDEPNFIKRLKEQAGYKEGPTVDTKREALPELDDDDLQDRDEDKPVVVVLKPGDLSEEEASRLQKEKDEESGPARLGDRIVFRKPSKEKTASSEETAAIPSSQREGKKRSSDSDKSKVKKQKTSKPSAPCLSFDADEES
ncbi:hypothetical protein LSTR_LSTR013154 [Laodelphax striatellus]|uniref:DUF4604 domain-containing protein n=1 Tax=Laodelphax striatellus TaxID=195883 RepID=A0A482WSG7_LAOST|nr:hypothetical protein LSTR_LSTR013154 [Laodelphax striatellus]